MRLWPLYFPDIPDFLKDAAAVPEMQRLKDVGMNCGCEYTSFPLFCSLRENYSRYDHSVGTALLVWRFTGDRRQTLAGLFHDIATPCFAHVVDFMLGDAVRQEATEGRTREMIAQSAAIQALLSLHGFTTDDVADYHLYPIADNDGPKLSSDRLEYTLGNLVNYGRKTRSEVRRMLEDITVLRNGDGEKELGFMGEEHAVSFAHAALDMGEIYVSDADRFSMQTLADLLKEAWKAGAISAEDLWRDEKHLIEKLCRSDRFRMEWKRYCGYRAVRRGGEGTVIRAKKRYIDPLVRGCGRVSQIEEAFRARVEAFLAESQDVPLSGI